MQSDANSMRLDFCSAETVRDNARAVIEFANLSPAGESPLTRKRALITALDHLQRTPNPAPAGDWEPTVVIVEDARSDAGAVAADLTADPELGQTIWPVMPVHPSDRATMERGVVAGLNLLKANDPRLYELVCELVGCVVIAGGPRLEGASKSSMVGTIYMNPQPRWTAAQYAETLLHETVHEAHFLDQMIRPWFRFPHWEYSERKIYARSPIRRVLRPLPLTLEACCVSIILIGFLWRTREHARAVEMCANTVESLMSIEDVRQHLASRGNAVFAELMDALFASEAFSAVKA